MLQFVYTQVHPYSYLTHHKLIPFRDISDYAVTIMNISNYVKLSIKY